MKQTKRVYSSNFETDLLQITHEKQTTSTATSNSNLEITNEIYSRRASICSNETATSLTTITTDKSVNTTKSNAKKTKK